ncbi:CoA transferase, partial [Klebsiella aerogenes]|uniref:CoA transferase n=1 Tax=Klebsiella aerogenes TaxID=548 RepID=UPI001954181F
YEAVTGRPAQPWSVKDAPWPVYDLFDSRDGTKIFVSIVGEEHWSDFCRAFGREAWLDDPRLDTKDARIAARGWMIPEIAAILRQYSVDD